MGWGTSVNWQAGLPWVNTLLGTGCSLIDTLAILHFVCVCVVDWGLNPEALYY